MNTIIISLIMGASAFFNLNPNLVVAVAKTESSLNPRAVGSVGEIGLFQVRPKYSKFSRKELFNPLINIVEGLRMLSFAKKHCKHRVDNSWLICYNLGVKGASKVRYPKKFDYYKKVMRRMK